MKILSLETATYFGGVGFLSSDVRESAGPFAPRGASGEILAAVHRFLSQCDCRSEDLDLVAVSTGPGLFTGVRVGLSIAKTLAWSNSGTGHGPALVGVPTLEAVASLALAGRRSAAKGDLVAAVTDARRGEVYTALFQVAERRIDETREPESVRDGTNAATLPPPPTLGQAHPEHALPAAPARPVRLRRLTDDMVVRPSRLARRLLQEEAGADDGDPVVWFVGDGAERYEEIFEQDLEGQARFFPFTDGNLPFEVAALALERFREGAVDDPIRLKPHYVRRPDARPPAI
ncbi:MAG TPA: tRNA (adenosine(37)-N6)-threonylcarbamoyltransferase complex dimerization subunit type 1 TsaB [Sumerlaeia bacterium]|nr:tRNA (adenosine(37)-N6)-threonylcarbamoyltransferase complex dimerization subunit type 1 TsaB [Sumerlaeia bacterium]